MDKQLNDTSTVICVTYQLQKMYLAASPSYFGDQGWLRASVLGGRDRDQGRILDLAVGSIGYVQFGYPLESISRQRHPPLEVLALGVKDDPERTFASLLLQRPGGMEAATTPRLK
jgi:hypothetical protein